MVDKLPWGVTPPGDKPRVAPECPERPEMQARHPRVPTRPKVVSESIGDRRESIARVRGAAEMFGGPRPSAGERIHYVHC